jgi:hypothetical protein
MCHSWHLKGQKMKTWKKFLAEKNDSRSVADVEEESGIDVDHDEEKNEPDEHKSKFNEAHRKMVEFFTKRKSGAHKIASQAIGNGQGPSQLTAWHFSAKAKPYEEVLTAIESGKPESYFQGKRGMAMERVHNSLASQKNFQESMGELEVWGEACIQLFRKGNKS